MSGGRNHPHVQVRGRREANFLDRGDVLRHLPSGKPEVLRRVAQHSRRVLKEEEVRVGNVDADVCALRDRCGIPNVVDVSVG